MRHLKNQQLFTTIELADLLGVSVVTINKRIKAGKIKAEMIGGSYLITKDEVSRIMNIGISSEDKERIKGAVIKTIKEYGNVLKMLGKE